MALKAVVAKFFVKPLEVFIPSSLTLQSVAYWVQLSNKLDAQAIFSNTRTKQITVRKLCMRHVVDNKKHLTVTRYRSYIFLLCHNRLLLRRFLTRTDEIRKTFSPEDRVVKHLPLLLICPLFSSQQIPTLVLQV